MAEQQIDIDELIRGDKSGRPWWYGVAAIGVVIAAAATFLFVMGDEAVVVTPPQAVEVSQGQLTTTVELFGTAGSANAATLTFGQAGDIVAVMVAAGDTVTEGQLLASLDTIELELNVATAELALLEAQDKLADLSAGVDSVLLAQRRLAVKEAQAGLETAQQRLADLFTVTPTTTALAAADAAITVAEKALETAEKAPALVLARAGVRLREAIEARDALKADPIATAVQIAAAENTVSGAFKASTDASTALSTSLKALKDEQLDLATANVAAAETAVTAATTPVTDAETALTAVIGDANATAEARAAAEATLAAAQATLLTANQVNIAALLEFSAVSASLSSVVDAEAVVVTAQATLAEKQADRTALFAPAEADVVETAELAVTKAEVALLKAESDLGDLFGGATALEITSRELTVRQRELQLAQATDALASAQLVAPFDAVIDAVNIAVGDRATVNGVAFAISDPAEVEIALSISESDVLDLAVGQVGLATFDAIDGVEYPVRITSVSRTPSVAQGVVTYPVTAVILTGPELAEVAADIAVLSGADGGGFAAFAGGGGQGAAVGGGGGRLAAGLSQLIGDAELPEGVTAIDVLRAVLNGDPLPAGLTLPEGFEIPEQFRERLQALVDGGGLDGAAGGAGGRPPADARGFAERPLPAPGMGANVTVLIDVRPAAVQVPTSAVRQLDGEFFVTVPAGDDLTERVTVTVGESDGSVVEILEGLAAGATVLIGATSDGVPFSATEIQGQQQPGFGGGGGGFGRGGGGFGGGGGPAGGGGGGGQ